MASNRSNRAAASNAINGDGDRTRRDTDDDVGEHAHRRVPPAPVGQNWMSHIPAEQPNELPHAPASFILNSQLSDYHPESLRNSPTFNLYLLNHHPAYAVPPNPGSYSQEAAGLAGRPPNSNSTEPVFASELFLNSATQSNGHSNRQHDHPLPQPRPPDPPFAQNRQNLLPSHQRVADGFADISPWDQAFNNLNRPTEAQVNPQIDQEVSSTSQVQELRNHNVATALYYAPPPGHRLPGHETSDIPIVFHVASDCASIAPEAHIAPVQPNLDQSELTQPSKRRRGRPPKRVVDLSLPDGDVERTRKRPRKGERPRGRRKGEIRGPRTTLNPGEDFMKVYNRALDAFIEKRELNKAHTLVLQAIGINPEIFAAHSLLADIHFAKGNHEAAIDALMVGLHAHLNDVELWRQTADRILNAPGESYQKRVERAMYCYGAILRKDSKDMDARFQRAECARVLKAWNRAFSDLNILMQDNPHNSDVLAQFARFCQEVNDLEKARKVYEDHFEYYQRNGVTEEDRFSWQDIGVYVGLLVQLGETATAVVALKRLARALCGRQEELFWEEIVEDDREFDQNHYPRRLELPEFEPNVHPEDQYGEALPLDLRGKLGILRLKLGFREEAQSHFDWLEPDLEGEESLVEEYSDTFYEVAKALHDAKEHEQALHFYNALRGEDIDLGLEFWIDMGASCYVCNQKEQAIQCYERSLELDPNNIEARTQLTKLHRDLGNRDLAIKYGNEAVVMAQAMIPQTVNRKYERKENRLIREAAENALKKAFRLPKGPGKAAGKVPKDLIYRTRTKRQFVRYVPQPVESEEAQPEVGTESESEYEGEQDPKAQHRIPEPVVDPSVQAESPIHQKSTKLSRRKGRLPGKPKIPKSKPPNQHNAIKHYEDMQQLYTTLQNHQDAMREREEVATNVWMDCAATMIDDFRTVKAFYPGERHRKFEGYSAANPRPRPASPANPREDIDIHEHSEVDDQPRTSPLSRPSPDPTAPGNYRRLAPSKLPDEYCGIRFAAWLDIFLELAILYATAAPASENQADCYAVINAAIDCNVFFHDEQSMTMIHACYLTCALALGDDLTLYNTVIRWFMREYAFCTDTYRLYMAINMVNELPAVAGGKAGQLDKAIFKAGPNQKFVFRQLMSIDKLLPADYNKDGPEGGVPAFMRKHREELRKISKRIAEDDTTKTNSVTVDERDGDVDANGDGTPSLLRRGQSASVSAIKTYSPKEMDVVLFILYAQIMMASGSFPNALSYLYRAYSLDSSNSVCLLSMSFCYLHELSKRQTGNRHSYALMGWVWLGRYEEERLRWAEEHDRRVAETGGSEAAKMVDVVKQEIAFNKARCWEMLGMADLGMRGYEEVLRLHTTRGEETDSAPEPEDWSQEAAYAMSALYALNGNGAKAREITEKYLTV